MDPFSPHKILYHSDRVAAWKRGETVWPVHAKVDPTNACNHACPDCIFKELLATNSESLSRHVLLCLIEDLARAGVRAITFSGGGEPLVNPHTISAMALARSLGIDCGLITNGVLLTPRVIPTVVDSCTWIRVSLDAASVEQHQSTHGARHEDFRAILDNLEECVAYRNNASRSCTIGVGYLTAARTMAPIAEVAALGSRLGIDYVQYRPYHDEPILRDGWPEVWHTIFADIEDAQRRYSRSDFKVLWTKHQFLDILEGNWGRTYSRCEAHAFEAVVGASGDVWFCCAYKGMPEMSLGNINAESFLQIWVGERRQAIFASTDVSGCVPLCHLHQANKSLALVQTGNPPSLPESTPVHPNFI